MTLAACLALAAPLAAADPKPDATSPLVLSIKATKEGEVAEVALAVGDARPLTFCREDWADRLAVALKKARGDAREPPPVAVLAGPDLQYGEMVRILDACRKAGLPKINLRVADPRP
jgi:biopolymer transport protein ExbD